MYNREQAENLADDIRSELPGIEVYISHINKSDTGEYVYSFVGIMFDNNCVAALDTHEDYNRFKKLCFAVTELLDSKVSDGIVDVETEEKNFLL